jgi:prepilin signal peptidase PulO-like enzyme (type II secretory pathway)
MGRKSGRLADADLLIEAGRALYWPRVLFTEDLASAFRLSAASVRRRRTAGDFGPCFRVGRRWAVLKDDLLAYLKSVSARSRAPVRATLHGEERHP